jgi:hypothetical protein
MRPFCARKFHQSTVQSFLKDLAAPERGGHERTRQRQGQPLRLAFRKVPTSLSRRCESSVDPRPPGRDRYQVNASDAISMWTS